MSTAPKAPKADPDLIQAGWEPRFLADPERLKEATSIYRSLGLEVCAAPLAPADFERSCDGCAQDACHRYVMIYTRKPPESLPV